VDAVLLDDGFQHRKLARDLDIVLIDALDPFGGGEAFPLGRLREPVSGIGRAGIVLITRSAFSDLAEAIEREVRRWNANAPIFRASVKPIAWVDYRTGARHAPDAPPFARAGAFCGLGNPQSFRRTLERLGVQPVDWVEFEDHHRYRPHEVRRMIQHQISLGADAMLTTEKDAINLSDASLETAEPLPLYWLQVGMQIEQEDEFARKLQSLFA
jgi:tetraacyldisaccharide 4'-kinase